MKQIVHLAMINYFFQQAQRTDKAQLTQQGEKNVCLLYTMSIAYWFKCMPINEMLYFFVTFTLSMFNKFVSISAFTCDKIAILQTEVKNITQNYSVHKLLPRTFKVSKLKFLKYFLFILKNNSYKEALDVF